MIKSERPPHNARDRWKSILLGCGVVLLLGGYWGFFLASRLPTLEDRLPPEARPGIVRRIDLVAQILLLPEEWLGEAWFGRPMQFGLWDRGPLLFWAGMVLATAWAAGSLLVRWLGVWERTSPWERHCFALAVGANLVSTYTLAVGLLGLLAYPAVFWIPALAVLAMAGGWGRTPKSPWDHSGQPTTPQNSSLGKGSVLAGHIPKIWFWAVLPFAGIIGLGAMLPPVDFDVREYHLQAPKEWYLEGRIRFLPHNVYANMPLGAEMLPLAAMGLSGQWWVGALAGKTAMAGLTLVCAAALWAIGQRMFSPQAGAIAALTYLATPWIVQVSTSGLNEGVTACYVLLGFWALWLGTVQTKTPTPLPPAGFSPRHDKAPPPEPSLAENSDREAALPAHPDPQWESKKLERAYLALAGYLVGATAATKYPAVVFVGVPALVWVGWIGLWHCRHQGQEVPPKRGKVLGMVLKVLGVFLLAALLGGGLWYVKNAFLTGNPVYPLFYSWLGGKNWDAEKEARWNRVHFPREFSWERWIDDLSRVGWRSEWIGPLIVPLALLAFWPFQKRRGDWALPSGLGRSAQASSGEKTAISRREPSEWESPGAANGFRWLLLGYVVFWMIGWWLLTHRIDRFWLPGLPMLALLAGLGACQFSGRAGQWIRAGLLILGLGYGFLVAAGVPAAGGYNRYFLPLETLRQDPRRVDPWHLWLNRHVQRGRVLLVGDAQPFDLEVPVLYATCFNDTPLEEICQEAEARTGSPNRSALESPNPSAHVGKNLRLCSEPEGARPESDSFSRGRFPAHWTTREFAEALKTVLAEREIEYIFVHWGEIARYRSPGNYGFSPMVQPELFDAWVRWGLLTPLPPLEDHPGRCYRVQK